MLFLIALTSAVCCAVMGYLCRVWRVVPLGRRIVVSTGNHLRVLGPGIHRLPFTDEVITAETLKDENGRCCAPGSLYYRHLSFKYTSSDGMQLKACVSVQLRVLDWKLEDLERQGSVNSFEWADECLKSAAVNALSEAPLIVSLREVKALALLNEEMNKWAEPLSNVLLKFDRAYKFSSELLL